MVSERLEWGPMCASVSPPDLVSAQEMATDTMTRPRDHSVTRGSDGAAAGARPRLRGPDSQLPCAVGSEGGEQSGAGNSPLTLPGWLSPGAP